MAIEFPSSPVDGETYTFNSRTWQWTGDAWRRFTNQGQVVTVLVPLGPIVQTDAASFLADPGSFRTINYV